MIISPYVFKTRALRALKGNWQTALLVSFFSTLPMTIVQLYQTTQLPDVSGMLSLEAAQAAIAAVDAQVWLLLGLLGGLSLVITPVLSLGRHQYFIQRLQKQELGFVGLFSRMGSFGKALLLYVLIYVKVFLWSLLFIVPGIIAALRYSLAPLYLAQDPQMGVLEALNRSKAAMRDKKLTMFMLQISFMVWLLAALLMEMLLSSLSPVLALVVSQFIQLMMATYLSASVAGFYLAASSPDGIRQAQEEAAAWLRTYGGSMTRRPFGNDEATPDEPQDGESGDAQQPRREDGDTPASGGDEDDAP